MHWLYTEFKPYCERKNIRLLKDDMKYIEKQLCMMPKDEHRRIMREYVKIWLRALSDATGNEGDNVGRRTANEYLLGA